MTAQVLEDLNGKTGIDTLSFSVWIPYSHLSKFLGPIPHEFVGQLL